MKQLPLDYASRGYAYLERPNRTLLALFEAHAPRATGRRLRVLDVGCGAGANAREIRRRVPNAWLVGIEPDRHAADLAREVFDDVRAEPLESAIAVLGSTTPFDVVILSDTLEHQVEPVRFLATLRESSACVDALYLCSVPNYAVWYNRARTLAGRFDYTWSGLFDRTHLRFFTRDSLLDLFEYVGLNPIETRGTPSFVQSFAPLLRRGFERSVDRGEHLALMDSPAFRAYQRWIEPVESAVCDVWPSLLAFQLVVAAESPRRRASATSCPP